MKEAQFLSPGADPLLVLPTAPLQYTQYILLSTLTSGSVNSFITHVAGTIGPTATSQDKYFPSVC